MVGIRMGELLVRKFRYIADVNGRSASSEGRRILRRYIEQYEKKHGTITLEQILQMEERLRNRKMD
jgi:hypothetical protein